VNRTGIAKACSGVVATSMKHRLCRFPLCVILPGNCYLHDVMQFGLGIVWPVSPYETIIIGHFAFVYLTLLDITVPCKAFHIYEPFGIYINTISLSIARPLVT
jgi:hypothetical protein